MPDLIRKRSVSQEPDLRTITLRNGMRRFTRGDLHTFLCLAMVGIQGLSLVWQSTHILCMNSSGDEVQLPSKFLHLPAESSHGHATPQYKRNKEVFRLKNGLQLTPNHVRAFPVLEREFPCFQAEKYWDSLVVQKSPATTGFLYVKARKASSSTVAGVAIRIARKFAKERNISSPVCQVRFNHPKATALGYDKRDVAKSFLWSILREPSRRFVSEFFHFGLSRSFIQPSDVNMKKYMEETRPAIDNYYLRWLSLNRYNSRMDSTSISSEVAEIIQNYDFLGISERLDESLVALQHILHLNTSDLLYLSAKVNGGWDDGVLGGQCYYITPSYVSQSMKQYFAESESWYNFSVGDDLLYRAANASLDETIQSMDTAKFQQDLQRLRWALRKADEVCRGNVTFPCGADGELNIMNDCMVWDSACGMDCLDRFAAEYRL